MFFNKLTKRLSRVEQRYSEIVTLLDKYREDYWKISSDTYILKESNKYLGPRLNNMQDEIDKLKPAPQIPQGRCKPDRNNDVWSIGLSGLVYRDHVHCQATLDERHAMGTLYDSEILATQARDKQLLLVEIQDDADKCNKSAGFEGIYISIHYCQKSDIFMPHFSSVPPLSFYFHKLIHCQNAIAKYKPRLHLLIPKI